MSNSSSLHLPPFRQSITVAEQSFTTINTCTCTAIGGSSSGILTTSSNKEDLEHLQRSLLKLNDKDRELIVMHKLQEMQYEQIATIVGSSENAVKVKTHRALKKLKDVYFRSVNVIGNKN